MSKPIKTKVLAVEVEHNNQYKTVVARWSMTPIDGSITVHTIETLSGEDIAGELGITERMKVLDAVSDEAKELSVEERSAFMVDQFQQTREAV